MLIRCAFVLGVIAGYVSPTSVLAEDEQVLRAVMHSDLKILDPGWTTAYITRNHGYMVYDTLFALDEDLQVQPQMVGEWSVSADGLAYESTLRDGLAFHAGAPVTGEDVVASLRRWGQKDPMGQRLMTFVGELKASGPNSFVLTLSEPYGLVLASLARPSFYVPFIMPKRVAETPTDEQIADQTGSGPFVFKKDEWRPGAQAVYVRNQAYKAREEPPSGLAGAKIVKLDRVEWVWIPDQQTAMNALLAGDIDLIEAPAHDLLPVLEADPDIVVENTNPLGYQYWFRFNFLHPPFGNPKIRQAAFAALSQLEFLFADVLAVAQAAKSVVLLGDPQQLKQPQQGSHPEGTDVSALEHLLGKHETIPRDRGLFLAQTHRLHPNVCAFTSELFYNCRLRPLPDLEHQVLDGPTPFRGAGLWFVPVDHNGNQNSSPEEVECVARLVGELLGGGVHWTNKENQRHLLKLDDILLIAPYNAQVAALAARLPARTRIGTVDKFQGQAAAVVIFSLATSSPEDAPRGMEFLYSLNRLNVAVSRAKTACILVANSRLFEPECRTPAQMRLANAFCRYLELAQKISATSAQAKCG